MADRDHQLRFGDFELDCRRRELSVGGRSVEVQAKPLELLIYLAQNRDRTVPKTELLECVWPDVVVSDTAVSSALKDLRRVLGDDGLSQRVIRTRRRLGYRFVAPAEVIGRPESGERTVRVRLTERGPSTRRAGMVSPHRAPIVGRGVQLAALEQYLREAAAGEPRFVLLTGEAGIGKTRLLDEFGALAAERGVAVAKGRCEQALAFPYRPFVGALSGLLSGNDDQSDELFGDDPTPLRELLHPNLVPRSRRDLDLRFHAEREQGEMFSAVSRVLARLARVRTSLVALEDLHWADQATLDLLEHLALTFSSRSRSGPVPLLLAATLRGKAPSERVAQTLARVEKAPIARRIELSGLDEAATRHLLESLDVQHLGRNLVATLHRLSGGNPLFVRVLASQLAEGGVSELELPSTLVSALAARLDRLSASCRTVLTVAAFIGERFGRLALAAASPAPEEEIELALAEATRAGVLREVGRAYCFEHPTVPHVLRSRVSDYEGRQAHSTIADVLEELYASSPGEHALEISGHLIQAADDVDPARLVGHATRAGEQAFAVCAWGEAARHFAAAALAADHLAAAERGRLHLRAAVAFNHDHSSGPCVDHYRRAVELLHSGADARGLAWARMYLLRAQLTLASVAYGSEPEIAPLERAIDSLCPGDAVLRGLALETISEAHWVSRRTKDAIDAASAALVIGHNERDDALCYHACMGLALGQFQALQVRDALGSWRDALAHAERARDLWLQTIPGARIAMAELLLGDLTAAGQYAERALERAERALNPAETSMVLAQQSALAAARGELSLAARYAAEALVLVERTGYPWAAPTAVPVLAACHAALGRARDAEAALELLVERGRLFDQPGPAMQILRDTLRAWIACAQPGWRKPSAASMERLVRSVTQGGIDPFFLGPACALAEALARGRFTELLGGLEQVLAEALERGVVFSSGYPFLIARILALMERSRKRCDHARSLFERAARAAADQGAVAELAAALRDCGEMLVENGDAAEGHEMLIEARRVLGGDPT